MKTATITEIKRALNQSEKSELIAMCLHLAKFKKETKELLTYLLFEASDERTYIQEVKRELAGSFADINHSNYYFIKKGVRKILKRAKTYIRYSKKVETELEIILHFCELLANFQPSIKKNNVLLNIFERELIRMEKVTEKVHEEIQRDYIREIEGIRNLLK